MFDYYTAIILLSWMELVVLGILVYENNRIKKRDKALFYCAYFLIAISALAELIGLKLNGNMSVPSWVIVVVKSFDYVLTPLAGGAVIAQIKIRNKWTKALLGILCFNTLFQIISAFTGWMTVIDDKNCYSHGPFYFIYMIVYILILAIVIIQFFIYGQSFSKSNRISINAILVFIFTGIGLQEYFGGEIRTAYLAITIGATLLFIHYTEYSQIKSDDRIQEQKVLITTDVLTGVGSRYAYVKQMKKYESVDLIPKNFVTILLDINGLKRTNDDFGHDAGDELICAAANCINSVFADKGTIYRIGGDEFVVFTEMSSSETRKALKKLDKEAAEWRGSKDNRLSISSGFATAADNPGLTCEELCRLADEEMYEAKDEYYRKNKIERRR